MLVLCFKRKTNKYHYQRSPSRQVAQWHLLHPALHLIPVGAIEHYTKKKSVLVQVK